MQQLDVEEFLTRRKEFPLLDTRSPAEYFQGHIPCAISFPLFTDTERANVGIAYKSFGKREALKVGLEAVGPKMADFIRRAETLDSQSLLIHCWRGGMRSSSMGWLLETAGFQVMSLKEGYKGYRAFLLHTFSRPINFRVLTGATGSGKTLVLQALKDLGAQVIDLEALACHNGSSFGNPLSKGQPSTEQFQNDLLEVILNMDANKVVWVEDESFMIGRVHLPEAFYLQKQEADHIQLSVPLTFRIENLVKTYGELPAEQLITATERIRKKLGGKNTDSAIAAIENGDLGVAASLILYYYDKAYAVSTDRKKGKVIKTIPLEGPGVLEVAKYLHSMYQ
ncbi:tRNA 2-selenouridine(34) synthase MnmH [Pleomorphovibrio marinus]|uniref:tRNA 2-selenouridine(34) synthase MnmH n=1 Tax=Pleomorphovibrio marinus TaxID=2164132 RepID=UPI000E0B1789|nr:tRNA 2-selenouridine(34) synthase MnmH [Pleomorphovibrio marinus]